MIKSLSVSSESSLPVLDEDADSVTSDELLGSQSRRWLSDLMSGDLVPDPGVLVPESGVLVPESGVLVPGSGVRVPESGVLVPGSGVRVPDPGDVLDSTGRDGLFVDYHFPVGQLEMPAGVTWRRPKELCSSPQFIVNGATRLDVRQGKLNDCWLLSAIASLSVHRDLLKKVMPPGQSFSDGYTGCFTFRFWQYGQWEDVRIDDLLPTQNNQLIYLSSPERLEFWSSLLEKAYAKLKGGYRALDMGFPHEAMVDMTGGVAEVLKVALLADLPKLIRRLLDKGALISCANCQGDLEQRDELGIMFRHAYSLTAVEKVETSHGTRDLVRILNPWGNTEWEGPWSDLKGPEWSTVSEDEQQRLELVRREDGEFWMLVSDFRQHFELMEVCHLPGALSESGRRPWACVMHHGNWKPGISAGGPGPGGLFWQNPQFYFTLSELDRNSDRSCSFILALMQKYQRRWRVGGLSIALQIYPAHPTNKYLSPDDLSGRRPLLCSSSYSQRREVVLRASLPPGRYIIIPSTAVANQQGAFLLRVLTEQGNAAIPAQKPPQDVSSLEEPSFPHLAALPSPQHVRTLFRKHCSKNLLCKPIHLHHLLTEALQGGVLAGAEKFLSLEHCKTLVVLMDNQLNARLSWTEFQVLWDKIRRWTDIFLVFDKNKTKFLEYKEVGPALKAAGVCVDDLLIQLVGLRYTEPDLTISYPGFLFLLIKLESMIHKFQASEVMGNLTVSYRQWLWMTMYT